MVLSFTALPSPHRPGDSAPCTSMRAGAGARVLCLSLGVHSCSGYVDVCNIDDVTIHIEGPFELPRKTPDCTKFFETVMLEDVYTTPYGGCYAFLMLLLRIKTMKGALNKRCVCVRVYARVCNVMTLYTRNITNCCTNTRTHTLHVILCLKDLPPKINLLL